MNNQEAFNTAVAKFFDGSGRCDSPQGGCAYLNGTGNRCVVGAMIPMEILTKEFQFGNFVSTPGNYSSGVIDLVTAFPEINVLFHDVDITLLSELQDIHDIQENWDPNDHVLNDIGIKDLQLVARRYQLVLPKELEIN